MVKPLCLNSKFREKLLSNKFIEKLYINRKAQERDVGKSQVFIESEVFLHFKSWGICYGRDNTTYYSVDSLTLLNNQLFLFTWSGVMSHRVVKLTCVSFNVLGRRFDGWPDNGWMDGQLDERNYWSDEPTDSWMDGWTDRWIALDNRLSLFYTWSGLLSISVGCTAMTFC